MEPLTLHQVFSNLGPSESVTINKNDETGAIEISVKCKGGRYHRDYERFWVEKFTMTDLEMEQGGEHYLAQIVEILLRQCRETALRGGRE